MNQAKALCVLVLVGCAILLALSIKIQAVWDFGNSPAGWWCAGVVAIIVLGVALRAMARR